MNKFLIVALLGSWVAAALATEDATGSPQLRVDVSQIVEQAELPRPVDGISSAGQPDAEAFRMFAEAGYVAVVDLRGPAEDRGLDEKDVVTGLGLDYVPLPIVGSDAINFDNASKLDSILAAYDGPVLLHCGSGNRVGALLALRDSLAGAAADAALDYGRSAGLTSLEPIVRERLEAAEAK